MKISVLSAAATLGLTIGLLLLSSKTQALAGGISSFPVLPSYTALELDSDDNPVVAYESGQLQILRCSDPACDGPVSIVAVDAVDSNAFTSLALDENSYPVVSYQGADNQLRLLHCNDAFCVGGNESIVSLGTARNNSLVLDHNGYPVISYQQTHTTVRLIHCNDPSCLGGDENVETIDEFGVDPSLALDADGYPVIAYSYPPNDAVRVVHCNDADCSGGDETVGELAPYGSSISLVLDDFGNPVLSYSDFENIRVAHCNDPFCAGGDESNQPIDSGRAGAFNDLELDTVGHPVVSYWKQVGEDLMLVHCNDADCTGGDESVRVVDEDQRVGEHNSLALSSVGSPVISYLDRLTDSPFPSIGADLNVARCFDPICACPLVPDFAFTVDDLIGDVTSIGVTQHDIASVTGFGDADSYCLGIEFADLVAPPGSGVEREVGLVVDFDVDEQPSTGSAGAAGLFCPGEEDMGADAILDVYAYNDGFAVLNPTGWQVPAWFLGNVVVTEVPIALIGGDPHLNLQVMAGTTSGPTDCTPLGAVLRSPDGSILYDSDGDTIGDGADNCITYPNPSQADSDMDGIGDACDAEPFHDLEVSKAKATPARVGQNIGWIASSKMMATVKNLAGHQEEVTLSVTALSGLPADCEVTGAAASLLLSPFDSQRLQLPLTISCVESAASGRYLVSMAIRVDHVGAGSETDLSNNVTQTTMMLRVR